MIRFLFGTDLNALRKTDPIWAAIIRLHQIVFIMLVGMLVLTLSFSIHLLAHYMRGELPL